LDVFSNIGPFQLRSRPRLPIFLECRPSVIGPIGCPRVPKASGAAAGSQSRVDFVEIVDMKADCRTLSDAAGSFKREQKQLCIVELPVITGQTHDVLAKLVDGRALIGDVVLLSQRANSLGRGTPAVSFFRHEFNIQVGDRLKSAGLRLALANFQSLTAISYSPNEKSCSLEPTGGTCPITSIACACPFRICDRQGQELRIAVGHSLSQIGGDVLLRRKEIRDIPRSYRNSLRHDAIIAFLAAF
jgi:hypothetical protein